MKVFCEFDNSRNVSIAKYLLLNKLRAMLQFVRRVVNKFNIFLKIDCRCLRIRSLF